MLMACKPILKEYSKIVSPTEKEKHNMKCLDFEQYKKNKNENLQTVGFNLILNLTFLSENIRRSCILCLCI